MKTSTDPEAHPRTYTAPALAAMGLVMGIFASGCGTLATRPNAVEPAISIDSRRATEQGPVIGFDAAYSTHAWLGIPFAQPPLDELRWRAPRPPSRRDSQLEATRSGSPCVQPAGALSGIPDRGESIVGSEDCLYLNVWAPRLAPRDLPTKAERLPVMVWVHGGGNTIGTASTYDGARLASAHGLVVVAVNYRLGPFGWFRHPALRASAADALDASGNYGTLDLIAALRWVQANISEFGGDPDRVTVFGESAGGVDIYSLLASPLAQSLFARAIIQSGLPSAERVEVAENPVDAEQPGSRASSAEVTLELLIARGRATDRESAKRILASTPANEIENLLRGTPARELMQLYLTPPIGGPRRGGLIQMPLVFRDGHVLPSTDLARHLASAQGTPSIPVILGTNRDELRLFQLAGGDDVCWLLFVLPRPCDRESYVKTAGYGSRFWKIAGADQVATAWVENGWPDVWVYRFDWDEEPEGRLLDLRTLLGAAHGMEIPFVFGNFAGPGFGARVFTPENQPGRSALSEAMMAYWAAFAVRGDPGRGTAGALPRWERWSQADPPAPRYLILDTPGDGGLRMALEPATREAWLETLAGDPFFSDRRSARCEMLERVDGLAEWTEEEFDRVACSRTSPVAAAERER